MRSQLEKKTKRESIVKITLVLVLAGIAAVLAAGCNNDLPVASTLERTRVLGASSRSQTSVSPRSTPRADSVSFSAP